MKHLRTRHPPRRTTWLNRVKHGESEWAGYRGLGAANGTPFEHLRVTLGSSGCYSL